MLRYYAIATVLVLGALALGLVFLHRGPALQVASVDSTGSPSAARPPVEATFSPSGVKGTAPWALSALTECFHQQFEAHGSDAYVRALVPRGAREVTADVDVTVADCRLSIYADAAEVERRDDRLFIPPDAHFYTTPSGALVLVQRAPTRASLRVYRPANGAKMKFERVFGTPEPAWCFQARRACTPRTTN
jgi:hypothetical protein